LIAHATHPFGQILIAFEDFGDWGIGTSRSWKFQSRESRPIERGSRTMANWQWFGKLHTRVYRATNGTVGGKLPGLPVLLLESLGRKSGEIRTSPLPYYQDDQRYVVVGSNNGLPRDPYWWLNLCEQSSTHIQVMGDRFAAHARLAAKEERERLWPALVEFNPPFAKYQQQTEREIPVVILERV
jgi:deazaflavin-dependent oxidoreductase (nitroreductase family)